MFNNFFIKYFLYKLFFILQYDTELFMKCTSAGICSLNFAAALLLYALILDYFEIDVP